MDAPICYLPFPTTRPIRRPCSVLLLVTLPSGIMYPNPTTGNWRDAVRTPEITLVLNGTLATVEWARKANATVFIEQVVDQSFRGFVKTHALRIWIPLSSEQVAEFTLHACETLITTDAVATAVTRGGKVIKKHRAEPEEVPPGGLSSVVQSYKEISDTAAFLRYYATSRGCAIAARHTTVSFTIPHATGAGDGELASDDDDDVVAQDVQVLPPNHVIQMLDSKNQFTADFPGILDEQKTVDNYLVDGCFVGPETVVQGGLLTVIPANAPFMGGSADGLLGLALPGATANMSTGELFDKLQTLRSLAGDHRRTSVSAASSFEDIKAELWTLGRQDDDEDGDGDDVLAASRDPTTFSPIQVRTGSKRKADPRLGLDNDNEDISAQLYPTESQYRTNFVEEQLAVLSAKMSGEISPEVARKLLKDIEGRVDNVYTGPAKAGMPVKLFEVYKEAHEITTTVQTDYAAGKGVGADVFKMLTMDQVPNMDFSNHVLSRMSSVVRNEMHKTPPQAAFVILAWIISMTIYKPDFYEAQPWLILLGGSDTGKSDAMDCLARMLLASAVEREDTKSAQALSENRPAALRIVDEQKTGTTASADGEDTADLTALQRGYMVRLRTHMVKDGNGAAFNVSRKSDHRGQVVSGSNQRLHKNHQSRAQEVNMVGGTVKDDRSRSEMTTLHDQSNGDFGIAVKMARYLWALHFRFWTYMTNLRFHVSFALYPIFYGIARNFIQGWQAREPTPRVIERLRRAGMACMVFRLTTEYLNISVIQRNEEDTFLEYIRGHAVVSLGDYALAYAMSARNEDVNGPNTTVLMALKESITHTDTTLRYGGQAPEMTALTMHDRGKYVVTVLTNPNEVMNKCKNNLGHNECVVNGVLKQLERPGSDPDGDDPVITQVPGRSKAYAVLHTHLTGPDMRTAAENAILRFLRDEVMKHRTWKISFDERYVLFPEDVLTRILEPFRATLYQNSTALRAHDVTAASIEMAMMFGELEGLFKYRDKMAQPPNFPLDMDYAGCLPPNVSAGAQTHVLADRGGPLDQMRVFYSYSIDDPSAWPAAESVSDLEKRVERAQAAHDTFVIQKEQIAQASEVAAELDPDDADWDIAVSRGSELAEAWDARAATDARIALERAHAAVVEATEAWARVDEEMASFAPKNKEQPKTNPVVRRPKVPRTMLNCLAVDITALRDKVDDDLADRLNIVLPTSAASTIFNDERASTDDEINSLFDACAGVSGEWAPGAVVFTGIDPRTGTSCETHTIRECDDDEIVIHNARRSTTTLRAEANATIEETYTPATKGRLTFPTTNSTLLKDVTRRLAAMNGIDAD